MELQPKKNLFDYNAYDNGHSPFAGFLDGYAEEMKKNKKKAERIHKDSVKIKKQMKIAKSNGIPVKHPGKLANHHTTNCGKARFQLCGNPRRIDGEKTIQEKRIEQDVDFD